MFYKIKKKSIIRLIVKKKNCIKKEKINIKIIFIFLLIKRKKLNKKKLEEDNFEEIKKELI